MSQSVWVRPSCKALLICLGIIANAGLGIAEEPATAVAGPLIH
jgi:hypothetical protein